MRESARIDKTQLPRDTYQEWLESQKEGPVAKGRGVKVTENSFEVWMEKRVDRQAKRASAKPGQKKTPA